MTLVSDSIVVDFESAHQDDVLIRRVRGLLKENVSNMPSLEAVAEKLGMNARALSRRLSRRGTNYQKEVSRLRLEIALQYLVSNDSSVTDIALQLGYCDTSAFCNAFKRWTGRSPRQYKQMRDLAMN